MGRSPCCQKKGLKKGPWTSEEDRILIAYIQKHGHENWRALPKLAGLLRCGKSCRLRWMNYLRPDIKRGNFSEEEQQTIIDLHALLGNRWSAIAARLPGRTDNEIKNVWHTHLKKKLKDYQSPIPKIKGKKSNAESNQINAGESSSSPEGSVSVMSSSIDHSSATFNSSDTLKLEEHIDENSFDGLDFIIDGMSFWDEHTFSTNQQAGWESKYMNPLELQGPEQELRPFSYPNDIDDGMDLWYDLFTGTAGIEALLQS